MHLQRVRMTLIVLMAFVSMTRFSATAAMRYLFVWVGDVGLPVRQRV